MPKLLQFDSCLNMLSTGRITESIGRLAIERGWDCYVVHGARYVGPSSCMHSIQAGTKWDEYLHYADSLFWDNHGLSSTRVTKGIIEEVKKIKPDVIQLHCIHGYYLNYKLLFEYLNSTDIPVVWTFHDCWAFTGHCSHFVNENCQKWQTGCHDCNLTSKYPKSFIDRSERNYRLKKFLFTSNHNLQIVSVSKWLEALIRESFFANTPIHTIYNGVDTELFKPQRSNEIRERNHLGNGKILLAVASAWSKSKGFDDYIQLSRHLPKDVKLVLVGLSDKVIKNLPANVIGIKRTESAAEMAQLYSVADIVLNLSYAETFGLTTVEGLACGTPGIVYNRTASPELIDNEVGMVVQPGDIHGVVHAIKEILSYDKTYYSNNCRNVALQKFDMSHQFNEYIDLYERCIK